MNTERVRIISGTQVNNNANDITVVDLKENPTDGIYIRKMFYTGIDFFIHINQADAGSTNLSTLFMQSQISPRNPGNDTYEAINTPIWLTKPLLNIITNQPTGTNWKMYIEYDVFPDGYLTSITTSATGTAPSTPTVVLSGTTTPRIIKSFIAAPVGPLTALTNVEFSTREIATPANIVPLFPGTNLDGESNKFNGADETFYLTSGYEIVISADAGNIDYFITYATLPAGL